MKILSVMWSVILFDLKPYNEDMTSPEIYELTKVAHLDKYEYLKEDYPYSDTVWDICEDLKEINVEYNQKLKNLFFQHWQKLDYSAKLRVFKNIDMPKEEKFNAEIKKYLVQNIIEYPSIMELHRFRKEMSQDNMKEALKNIYKQTNFHFIKNQSKEDYWENHISGKEEEKLLDLIELSGMGKEELTDFNKIGFFNKTRQARFDRLNNQETQMPLLESADKEVYLLTTKFNEIVLLKENDKLGTNFLMSANKYIHRLLKNAIENESLEMISVTNVNPLKFITEDKEVFNKAIIKRNIVINWIENNQTLLIEKIKTHIQNNQSLVELHEETKELVNKIFLKSKLEDKLIGKENKIKGIKKI